MKVYKGRRSAREQGKPWRRTVMPSREASGKERHDKTRASRLRSRRLLDEEEVPAPERDSKVAGRHWPARRDRCRCGCCRCSCSSLWASCWPLSSHSYGLRFAVAYDAMLIRVAGCLLAVLSGQHAVHCRSTSDCVSRDGHARWYDHASALPMGRF